MSEQAQGDVTEPQVLEALRAVQDPDLHRDIVSLGFVKDMRVCGGNVAFTIQLTTPACPVKDRLKAEAHAAVSALPGVEKVAVTMTAEVRRGGPSSEGALKGVRNTIAVASGKGGVGKSTVTANLAMALARAGARVGLLDADVYGPSLPHMMGGTERPAQRDGRIVPIERHGVKLVSMGLLTGPQTPVIWRGPMATKLIQQFLTQVEWGELDYLLVDLPPGTGDVQLTLAQTAPLSGAVIVTTPQDVAVEVTLRGARMFEQVHVPIIGVIENMSYFVCGHCDERTEIFRHGSAQEACRELGFDFLGEVPIDPRLSLAGDAGEPIVMEETAERAPSAGAFEAIAQRVAARISVINDSAAGVRHSPKEIKSEGGDIVIVWFDEETSRHAHRDLRLRCPCAVCIDEWTGERRLDPDTVPAEVYPVEVRPVGRYAIQPIWSDGHASGIYTFNLLRDLHERSAVSTG